MDNKNLPKIGNPDSPMGKRIAAAAKAAEDDFNKKIEQSSAANVDVRSFFTDDELEELLSGNEFFNGKIADLSKRQRYDKAVAAARWLEANSIEVVKMEAEGVARDRPNAIICLDMRRLASLMEKELKLFTAMFSMADSVFLSGIKDSHIRFTFGVEGIWQE